MPRVKVPGRKRLHKNKKSPPADSLEGLRAKARAHNKQCHIPLYKHRGETVTKPFLKAMLKEVSHSKKAAPTKAHKAKAHKSKSSGKGTKGQQTMAKAVNNMSAAYSKIGEVDSNPEYAFDVGQGPPKKHKKVKAKKKKPGPFGAPMLQADAPVNILKPKKKKKALSVQ